MSTAWLWERSLRSGDQLRATTQLVEAPGGTLLTSHTVQSSLGDLFRLQDDIARRVVEALALPLAGGTRAADARRAARRARLRALPAGERAGAHATTGCQAARDLYQRCLELDPRFAPAWAHLGRCHRVIGKYIEARPRARRAPRRRSAARSRSTPACRWPTSSTRSWRPTSVSHRRALVRLLGEADRHGNDPELFAGLVHACRYCGLFEQSIAAHAEARRLDPNMPTSFEQTLLMTGDDRSAARARASGA